jgi:hypothetical protein
MAVNVRIFAISSMKRTPAFTKNEMRPTTWDIWVLSIFPESRTASSTSIAVASA